MDKKEKAKIAGKSILTGAIIVGVLFLAAFLMKIFPVRGITSASTSETINKLSLDMILGSTYLKTITTTITTLIKGLPFPALLGLALIAGAIGTAIMAFSQRRITGLQQDVTTEQGHVATQKGKKGAAKTALTAAQTTATAAQRKSTNRQTAKRAARQHAATEKSRADAAEQRVADLEAELETVADVTRQLSFLDDEPVASASAAADSAPRVEEFSALSLSSTSASATASESESETVVVNGTRTSASKVEANSDDDAPAEEDPDTSARQQMLFS